MCFTLVRKVLARNLDSILYLYRAGAFLINSLECHNASAANERVSFIKRANGVIKLAGGITLILCRCTLRPPQCIRWHIAIPMALRAINSEEKEISLCGELASRARRKGQRNIVSRWQSVAVWESDACRNAGTSFLIERASKCIVLRQHLINWISLGGTDGLHAFIPISARNTLTLSWNESKAHVPQVHKRHTLLL